MFLLQLLVNSIVFIIGVFGIIFNRRSILVILMCIELILLSVNLNFIIFSLYLDDITGQVISLFVLTVTAAESAIGLAILILYYRVKGNILITHAIALKG